MKHGTNLWTFVLRPTHAICEVFLAMTPRGFVTPQRRIREDLNFVQRRYENIKSLMLFIPPFPPFVFYSKVKKFSHEKYFERFDSSVNYFGVYSGDIRFECFRGLWTSWQRFLVTPKFLHSDDRSNYSDQAMNTSFQTVSFHSSTDHALESLSWSVVK